MNKAMKEFIEIPFGAKDSELCRWEYTIPEGYTASIENGKIVVKKEESNDEEIRKALINIFATHKDYEMFFGVSVKDIHAWLKRQGESKFEQCIQEGDKIVSNEDGTHFNMSQLERVAKKESKFKAGQWIIDTQDGEILYINKVLDYAYEVKNLKGGYYEASRCSIETCNRLWTIQDAKDGDVICAYPNANHPWIGIFCKLNDEGTFNSHCYLQAGQHGQFCIPGEENIFGKRNAYNHSSKDVVPATKEQRDLLFQKMKEAGYEWDAEKKEPKKIETKPAMEIKTPEESLGIDSATYNKIVDECIYGEQKHAWSEEDEVMLGDAIFSINHESVIEGLKSRGISYSIESSAHFMKNLIAWLKSLKDRVQLQPQKEWSEDDETNLTQLHKLIVENAYREYEIDTDDETLYGKWLKLDNWLKSLKPQLQWKPSEEQLTILLNATNGNYISDYNRQVLSELYRNLKKL